MNISKKEYRQRRQKLMAKMAKIGKGTAIFKTAPHATMHNDVDYVFRQDSDFYYLTGFNESDAVLVLAPHHKKYQVIMFVQPKDPKMETWTGYRLGVKEAKGALGVDKVYSIKEIDKHLPKYLIGCDRIYYHLGRDKNFNAKIIGHWQHLIQTYPKRGTGPVAIEDSNFLLHSQRLIKTPAEIEMIRKAIDISIKAHLRAREFAKPGRYEYEVESEMAHTFRNLGGSGPAYPSIVASGANACVLHYIDNHRKMKKNELLLIDAGCAYGYYNGDITRTFPISGKFTQEQKAIYEIVLEAQLAAINELKPGNKYITYHKKAIEVIVDGLLDLKLLKGDKKKIIKKKKYKPFFMHGTGHWLGLDVHDAGLYKHNKKKWQILQPGHILTAEPGIYISPNIKPAKGQPEIPDRWKGIGIRIEDDVLITKSGNEVLSAALPK